MNRKELVNFKRRKRIKKHIEKCRADKRLKRELQKAVKERLKARNRRYL